MNKSEYEKYLKSPRWRRIQFSVKFTQRGACAVCGRPASPMIIHHTRYDRVGNEDPADVVGLCRSCHDIFHKVWRRSHDRQDIAAGQEMLEFAEAAG